MSKVVKITMPYGRPEVPVLFASAESDGAAYCPVVANEHLDHSVEAFKTYVCHHIVCLVKGVYAVWQGGRDMLLVDQGVLFRAYLNHKETVEQAAARMVGRGDRTIKPFEAKKWFEHHVSYILTLTLKPRAPFIFSDPKTGVKYVNQFKGLPFEDDTRKFADFDAKARAHVDFILTHCRKILTSDSKHQYENLLQWLAFTVNGLRTRTTLFLSSAPGTGKTTFFGEFFGTRIIGSAGTYHVTSAPECVVDHFNAELYGKTFIFLDDVKRPRGGWEALYNGMKAFVTSEEFSMRRLYSDSINVPMMGNIVTSSNYLGDCAMGDDDRRVAYLDISSSIKGNTKYFDRLYEAVYADDVPEAFTAYLRELFDPKYDFRKLPASENRRAGIINNLSPLISFLRERYILPWTKDGNVYPISTLATVPYGDLNAEYMAWNETARRKAPARELSNEMIKKLNLKATKSVRINNATTKCYTIDKDELLDTFRKNLWVDELDGEIDNPPTYVSRPLPPPGKRLTDLTIADMYDDDDDEDFVSADVAVPAAAESDSGAASSASSCVDALEELGVLE